MSWIDLALWTPIRSPEVVIALLLAAAGVGWGALDARPLGLSLTILGILIATWLRPPQHKLKGYGRLKGDRVPQCTPQGAVRISGDRFVDEHGRTLLLRGVNLSGGCKLPSQPLTVSSSGIPIEEDGGKAFFNHRAISFVGRPFPLERADEHFSRLRLWGFTFLRLLVTWEAIEHAGPGEYDNDYLQYLLAVVRRAQKYGITVFIDPHMDCWSRFTGGDGAPGWTLEAVGFDLQTLHVTGAAFLHNHLGGQPMPPMVWPTNTLKLASATMYTLFFAGDDFAPRCKIDGEGVQVQCLMSSIQSHLPTVPPSHVPYRHFSCVPSDLPHSSVDVLAQGYLQRHFAGAMMAVARLLKDEPNVAGFDSLNEPSNGFIGRNDLTFTGGLRNGLFVTAWQVRYRETTSIQRLETLVPICYCVPYPSLPDAATA